MAGELDRRRCEPDLLGHAHHLRDSQMALRCGAQQREQARLRSLTRQAGAAQLLLHDPRIDPGAFALVGMGTFYGGLAHVPIASLVMVCVHRTT